MTTILFVLMPTAGVVVAYKVVTHLRNCSATDILPFLRKIDMELVYGTFHPEAEAQLRERLDPEEFPEAQFKRVKMAIHYSRELAHNSRFFQLWAFYERRNHWHMLDKVLQGGISELRIQCMRCRLLSLYVRTRLRFWLLRMRLLPFLPLPSFQNLTRHGSSDMIALYDTVRELADSFGEAYGEDYHNKLQEAL